MNGDIFNPECDGIEGVIDAYKHAIRNVKLYGPTNFSEILKLVVDYTEAMEVSQDNQKYNILLIITDGIISDMPETIDEIVRGSSMALSIIIVGVGNANFDKMDELDADDTPLYSKRYKRKMAADIVQFVPFREFHSDPIALARETLTEVPGQLIDFMKRQHIVPKAASEFEKQKIQAQLAQKTAQQKQVGLENEPIDDFFGT